MLVDPQAAEHSPAEAPAEAAPAAPEDPRARVIRQVIEEIRPNLQRDGGDCQLVEVNGARVTVKLTGACVMCKLSAVTLEGIQTKIVERLGEFVRLVPVMGGLKA